MPIQPSARPGSGLRGVGVGSLEQSGQSIHGFGVASDAKTADHAQPRLALDLAEGIAQGVVDRGVADGFQGIACHVREFLIAQQGGQRGNRFLGGDAGQLPAGGRLFLNRRVRAEHGEQLGFLGECVSSDGGQQGCGQDQKFRLGVWVFHMVANSP